MSSYNSGRAYSAPHAEGRHNCSSRPGREASGAPCFYTGAGPCMPETFSMPATYSYSITRHPDGSITETYSTTSYQIGARGASAFSMPGASTQEYRALLGRQMPWMQDYARTRAVYDSAEEEQERKRKSEEPKKQAVQNFEKTAVFSPDEFITSPTPFIGEAEEIMPYVEEAFRETAGRELPKGFSMVLCDYDDLKRAHKFFNGSWSEGIQGFCINRNGFGESRIFVKKDELARVMLTIGHELGHIQTAPLKGADEEAKAFAFSMEWMKKIKEKNIAGLGHAIICEKPAENGLHNVAFDFVANIVRQGMPALEVFRRLIEGEISC